MDREEAVKLIRKHIKPDSCDEVIAKLRPAIGMVPRRDPHVAEEVAVSRMAGSPDVPPGFKWPFVEIDQHLNEEDRRKKRKKTAPLRFLLQVNLAELGGLPAYDELPKHGLISVFFIEGTVRVFYFRDTSKLAAARPPEFPEDGPAYQPCRIEFVERWSAKDIGEMSWTVEGKKDDSLWTLIAALTESKNGDIGGYGSRHHLLGHPQSVQNDVRYEWHLERNGHDATFPRTRPAAREGYVHQLDNAQTRSLDKWRLLFEIDSDTDGPRWMWGDVGRLYVGLLEDELKQRQFDQCELVWQSH